MRIVKMRFCGMLDRRQAEFDDSTIPHKNHEGEAMQPGCPVSGRANPTSGHFAAKWVDFHYVNYCVKKR
jgi:hypothetical protein